MRGLILAVAAMIAIDVFLFFGQTAVHNVAASVGSDQNFYDYNKGIVGSFDNGNYTLKNGTAGSLPDVYTQSSGSSTFTDTFSSIKNWILDKSGVSFIIRVLDALPSFLTTIGLPPEISYGLGVLWHALTLIMLVAFIKGGSGGTE